MLLSNLSRDLMALMAVLSTPQQQQPDKEGACWSGKRGESISGGTRRSGNPRVRDRQASSTMLYCTGTHSTTLTEERASDCNESNNSDRLCSSAVRLKSKVAGTCEFWLSLIKPTKIISFPEFSPPRPEQRRQGGRESQRLRERAGEKAGQRARRM